MPDQALQIKCAIQVGRPVHEVFEAIVDPGRMSNYFISYGSRRMEEGRSIIWQFPEFAGDTPIRVGKIETDKLVSFYWDVAGNENLTEITLEPTAQGNATVITVTESGPTETDEAGLDWLKGNTEGWANFLACLKAYVEYGINLRTGAFEFRGEQG